MEVSNKVTATLGSYVRSTSGRSPFSEKGVYGVRARGYTHNFIDEVVAGAFPGLAIGGIRTGHYVNNQQHGHRVAWDWNPNANPVTLRYLNGGI